MECMASDPDTFSEILSQSLTKDDKLEEDEDENAELSFASATSEAPDDPSPRDARRALKTLQSFAAKNLVGVAAMDALMKLEICITDAKLEPVLQFEQLLPE